MRQNQFFTFHKWSVSVYNEARPRERSDRGHFCLREKKPLDSGSFEHRVPKIKVKLFFCMYVCLFVCVIQHRNWPHRSTILNAHGTNASPDGLCTRTHTDEAFSCWFCCNSFIVDRARRGNVCLEDQAKACSPTDQPVRKIKDGLRIDTSNWW